MKDQKFELGITAKDKITGMQGVLTALARYITGCDQYLLSPPAKENPFVEGKWFDETRLEIVHAPKILMDQMSSEKNGCSEEAPIK